MAIEWIKANLALQYAAFGDDEYTVRKRIIDRANAGLIAAKAQRLLWNNEEGKNQRIPCAFWRIDELDGDLDEDWQQGDFQRSDRFAIQEQALDVSFDFLAISDLVPSDRQADAMRQISLTSDSNWMSSCELHKLMFKLHNPTTTGQAIVEACRLGQIAGRADRMVGEEFSGPSKFDPSSKYGALAWDIPLWFWRDFIKDASIQQWSLNKVRGEGYRDRRRIKIELQGVHFHRSGLVNLGLDEPATQFAPRSQAGRRLKYDWSKATAAIWGQIYRGELKPEKQADIERALQAYLADGDKEPSESTVRPYAKDIWEESQKA